MTHPVIDVAAYSMDADAAFSEAELDVVQEVWARVAEDYAPFDVDVTTEDPGTAALVRCLGRRHGVRHAGVDHDRHLDCGRRCVLRRSCAGVAYIGIDNVMLVRGPVRRVYQPAFALPKPTYTAASGGGDRQPRGRPQPRASRTTG